MLPGRFYNNVQKQRDRNVAETAETPAHAQLLVFRPIRLESEARSPFCSLVKTRPRIAPGVRKRSTLLASQARRSAQLACTKTRHV